MTHRPGDGLEGHRRRSAKSMRVMAERRKAKGACVRCGKPAIPGTTSCAAHADFDANRAAARRERHAALGLCRRCRAPKAPGSLYCAPHAAKEKARTKKRVEARKAARAARPKVPRAPTPGPLCRPNRTSDERRSQIHAAFLACEGNGEAAADRLGVTRAVVNKLARQFGWREGLPPRRGVTEPRRYPALGTMLTLSEMAERSGETRNAIKMRLRRGATPEKAMRMGENMVGSPLPAAVPTAPAVREGVAPPAPLPAPKLPVALVSTHYGAVDSDAACRRAWISEFGSRGTLNRADVTCRWCLRALPATGAPPPAPVVELEPAPPVVILAPPPEPPAVVEEPLTVALVLAAVELADEPAPCPIAPRATGQVPQVEALDAPRPRAPRKLQVPAPAALPTEAELEALALETPEAAPSPWDPEAETPTPAAADDDEAEEEDDDPPEPVEPIDEEEPAKLPDDLPANLSADLRRVAAARALEAREKSRMAAGFYLGTAGAPEEDAGDEEETEGYGEQDAEDAPAAEERESEDEGEGAEEHDPSVTLEVDDLLALNRAHAFAEPDDLPGNYERPLTRGDCMDGERPCPWVGCRWHLYLDVLPGGRLKINFPRGDVGDMEETCALDVADRGDLTLEAVGRAMNVSRERIRQMEAKAGKRIRRSHDRASLLRQFTEGGAMVVKKVAPPRPPPPPPRPVVRLPMLPRRAPAPPPPAPPPAAPVPPPPAPVVLPPVVVVPRTVVRVKVPPAPKPPKPPRAPKPPPAPRPPSPPRPPPLVLPERPVVAPRPIEADEESAAECSRYAAPAPETVSRQMVGPTVIFDVLRAQSSVHRMHPGATRIDRITEPALLELTAHLRTVLWCLHHAGMKWAEVALRFNVSIVFVRKLEARALAQMGVRLPATK